MTAKASRRAVVIVAAVLGTVAGCAGSRSTSKQSAAQADAARQALATYRAMWHDVAVASHTADYESSLVAQHADGDALELVQQSLFADYQQRGLSRGFPRLQPRVVSVKLTSLSAEVDIVDCFDDRTWATYVDGRAQDPRTLGRHRTTATVAKIAGVWKVIELAVGALRTC